MVSYATGHVGRPRSTSHAEIEVAAFELFASRGFEATTLDDIAEAVGVGRRTLFRYFASKNDIPWGRFDDSLAMLKEYLVAEPHDRPLFEAVHRAVVRFNELDPSAVDQHRQRMALIMQTPALQAHSALRYEDWRRVIAEYVADRCGLEADDPMPRLVGHVSLALSLAAYERWLSDPDSDLRVLMLATAPMVEGYVVGS